MPTKVRQKDSNKPPMFPGDQREAVVEDHLAKKWAEQGKVEIVSGFLAGKPLGKEGPPVEPVNPAAAGDPDKELGAKEPENPGGGDGLDADTRAVDGGTTERK